MSGAVAATGLCRLRFRAPEAAFELAVPGDVVLADLMPTVVGYAGTAVEESGVEHDGWVLQRLGGEPFDEELTLEALAVRDGEELFLRPRRDALPEVHFDDLVDGVRTGVIARGDSWRPAVTHHLALALTLLALVGGLLLLALPGPEGVRCVCAAVAALLLFGGAAAASRAVGDAPAGTALGTAAVAYAAAAAALVPGLDGPTRLLAGGSAAVGGAVVALVAVGGGAFFPGLLVAAVLVLGAGALAACGMAVTGIAALVAAAAVLLGAFVPGLAFKLSGLRLPALPRNADELQEEIEPFPAEDVLARSTVADGYLSAFLTAVGAVCAAALVVLAGVGDTGWGTPVMAADLSALLLLHARDIGSIRQRLAVLLPGVLGLTLLAARIGLDSDRTGRLVLFAVLLLAALGLAVVAWTVPGRRLLPYWGRAGDLTHSLAAIALLPLALQVLGFYRTMRGLGG
ncbi:MULTISPECIES: type VII secretion integral membrane protein EccD [unclassified Streptomyces]|uniref:type VII secretion integral membrane protein EccD n=1 Tax=Streptomycetaceae TaxID=2062 RepID=UPI002E79083F|nr:MULTISPECIES: type VII secretion integral membrane protein EccD [unclassified Streptomyces]MED7955011.1 type VII secretion integral membrane protein EccD [Streptomyces sp. BE303]MEE1828020.1 type VII secretion integral membrane protein EccD [Streptomyces sp. BE20]